MCYIYTRALSLGCSEPKCQIFSFFLETIAYKLLFLAIYEAQNSANQILVERRIIAHNSCTRSDTRLEYMSSKNWNKIYYIRNIKNNNNKTIKFSYQESVFKSGLFNARNYTSHEYNIFVKGIKYAFQWYMMYCKKKIM